MELRAREGLPVLVVQAESLGAIAVIRSLGRAGYPVHACATSANALGLRSRFARASVVCPPYHSSSFLPWLRRYVFENRVRAIVPSESFLLAMRPSFPEFAPLLTCGAEERVVYAGMSKFELFERLLGEPGAGSEAPPRHLPPTLLVEGLDRPPSPARLEGLGSPLYLKVDAAHGAPGAASEVAVAHTPEAARGQLARWAPRYARALVQGHVAGRGVGAFFLLHRGEVLAEFMHRRLHEVPHTGGASSFRESWYHPAIRDDALEKLRRLGWQGVAMMEYRWDAAMRDFRFLEMNGRFWGSLHLALVAGVDFPRLLLDAFFGRPVTPVRSFPLGVRCRHTFPAELHHLWTRLKDPGLGLGQKLRSLGELVALGADPSVHSDLLFPGDRGLYVDGLLATLSDLQERVARRWRGTDAERVEDRAAADEQGAGAVPRRALAHAP